MATRYEDWGEDEPERGPSGGERRFREFDCPDCDANNPREEIFGDGDEVLCFYCGAEFRVRVREDGRLRLQPT